MACTPTWKWHLHCPAALPSVPIGWVGGLAPKPVRTFGEEEYILPLSGIEPQSVSFAAY